MTKKILISLSAVIGGVVTGLFITRLVEKKREDKLGGKLMHVHYRFSKDFDD